MNSPIRAWDHQDALESGVARAAGKLGAGVSAARGIITKTQVHNRANIGRIERYVFPLPRSGPALHNRRS